MKPEPMSDDDIAKGRLYRDRDQSKGPSNERVLFRGHYSIESLTVRCVGPWTSGAFFGGFARGFSTTQTGTAWGASTQRVIKLRRMDRDQDSIPIFVDLLMEEFLLIFEPLPCDPEEVV